ncbi:MAG TPA: hypothetical protein VMY77_04670 [Chitinophagaceae bacterium]|nr:hypothetical protein [Chitinophagaceae bacterium]
MHKSPLYLPRKGRKWRRLKRKITTHVILRFTLFIFLILFSMVSFAQDKAEMADSMRSNGKIYVVVAVCLTILIGLFIYVFMVDRKISRFEKNRE